MTDFFTSDTHFGHANVIAYSKRPFKTVEEMDAALVQRWNERVLPGDRVFHLGDVALTRDLGRVDRLLGSLNGQKFWILGNHDHEAERKTFARHFAKIVPLLDIRIGKGPDAQSITLCHYAMIAWNKSHHGSWMLHGHHHGELEYPFPAKIADVGVDVWNFAPVSFEELKAKLDPMPKGRHHDR